MDSKTPRLQLDVATNVPSIVRTRILIYVTSHAKTFQTVAVRTLNGMASERLNKPFETGNVNG